MTKKEKKQLAQYLLMQQISIVGYGSDYEEFVKKLGSQEEADKVMFEQMNRIAKLFGYKNAWFS